MTPYASATSGIAEIIADARAIRSERHRRCDKSAGRYPRQPPPRKTHHTAQHRRQET
jgi:hypothetical protein